MHLAQPVADFFREEEGPTAVEYAVMLALIIAVCVGAIATLGNNANSVYRNDTLNNAVSGSSSS
jgi:pilus assembly protein Flp/PilA